MSIHSTAFPVCLSLRVCIDSGLCLEIRIFGSVGQTSSIYTGSKLPVERKQNLPYRFCLYSSAASVPTTVPLSRITTSAEEGVPFIVLSPFPQKRLWCQVVLLICYLNQTTKVYICIVAPNPQVVKTMRPYKLSRGQHEFLIFNS